MPSPKPSDALIVGGGIVGLATAMELLERFPRLRLVLLEKEPRLAAHQTGHNSGVIHSGIYYRPGSLKAKACVTGARLLVAFCQRHGIPYELCGKLVVATSEEELLRLKTLYERGQANGVAGLRLIGPEAIREMEPHARGVQALHVPGAGIVDYTRVAEAMGRMIEQRGGRIVLEVRATRFHRRDGLWRVETTRGDYTAAFLLTCGGLHSDRLAQRAAYATDARIIPFRGEYYDLVPERRHVVRAMIYPVPDPAMPFLGVHFTRSITGVVHAGPNAVLALKREGYRKRDVSLADTLSTVGFGGFWRMARRHWRAGLAEAYRSWSKRAFVRALQRLVPEIQPQDLVPDGSGVRAQAVDGQGRLVDDFDIAAADHAIHVRNVPSPAATACLCVGSAIADMAASLLTVREAAG